MDRSPAVTLRPPRARSAQPGAWWRREVSPDPLQARPPVKGWCSWTVFGTGVNETAVLRTAEALVARGLAAAGYDTVVVDDCWAGEERDEQGRLVADAGSFPSGIPALAGRLRTMGLRLGLYLTAGERTCVCQRAGSLWREQEDAATLRDWGVSLLKYDNCQAGGRPEAWRYADMAAAARAQGWEPNMHICTWGCGGAEEWAGGVGRSYRTYEDVLPGWPHILRNADATLSAPPSAALPDSDPLVLMEDPQQQATHVALWALLRGPLLLGWDVAAAPQSLVDLVTNPRLLALHGDPSGPAVPLAGLHPADGSLRALGAPCLSGAAVLMFNPHGSQSSGALRLEEALPGWWPLHVQDLWTGTPWPPSSELKVTLPPYGHVLLLLSPPAARAWMPNTAPLVAPKPRCYKDRGVATAGALAGALSMVVLLLCSWLQRSRRPRGAVFCIRGKLSL